MKFILDTANLEDIKKGFDLFPVEGVTTNPTIISKENRNFFSILEEIRQIIGEETELHVQLLGDTAEKMLEEAKVVKERIGGNLYMKVPVSQQGIKAMKLLKKEGYKITATAVITPNQALIAAKAGADYVAPYVNRIDNLASNGTQVVADIVEIFEKNSINTNVLAASFKNAQQFYEVAKAGCPAVTVPFEILQTALSHPLTDASLDQFIRDWDGVYGEGKTILDL